MLNNEDNTLKYLTASANDKSWGMFITTVGRQRVPPNANYPAMQHPMNYDLKTHSGRVLDEYQLVYITEGSGFFETLSMSNRRIDAGTVIMLFPGEWHNYAPDKATGWSEYWIGFKGEFIDRIVEYDFLSPRQPIIKIGPSNSLMALYRDAIRLADKEGASCQQLLSGIVMHMLGHILYKDKNMSFNTNRAEEVINEARQLMSERVHRSLSAEGVAKELGVGYSWFRQNFKRIMGVSPAQHISNLLISRAKEILVVENCTIAEVAYMLGFENAGQFSTIFRKTEGITPRQFREKNSKYQETK